MDEKLRIARRTKFQEKKRTVFHRRFIQLVNASKLTNHEIAERTGLPVSRINWFIKGYSYPYKDNMAKIAKAFGVDLEYLNVEGK